MKKGVHFIILILLFLSCDVKNPGPESFLSYSNPSYKNLDSNKLYKLDSEIELGSFGDIHSLLIIKNSSIVFEKYYNGYQRSDLHPIGASTQSIVSTLIGNIVCEDSSLNLDTKIINLLPDYAGYFDDIPQKDQIELGHLMSNTSGFWWDEWKTPFGNDKNDAYAMTLSNDWVIHVLATPMIREPGFEFNYNSGNAILMAPIIQQLTGIELEQFAKQKLFDPLAIEDWEWERIPGDYVNASWGLHLKPMDLVKIGYLFLQNGDWDGQIIFDENWSQRSSRYRAGISNYYNYGYFWWRFTNYTDVVRLLKRNDVFFSWGDGGQFLFIIPHLDMVVVTTAGNSTNDETLAIDMLKDYILPSVDDF